MDSNQRWVAYEATALATMLYYHIETHSAPLTTLFLSIQDAPGMNPADPLGYLYLSIQIESVFQYNFSLRSASQQGGLLSLLSKLCAVLSQREKYISKFLKNPTQLLDRLLLSVYYNTVLIDCQLLGVSFSNATVSTAINFSLTCINYSTGWILCLPVP